jgi:hypothetical protein
MSAERRGEIMPRMVAAITLCSALALAVPAAGQSQEWARGVAQQPLLSALVVDKTDACVGDDVLVHAVPAVSDPNLTVSIAGELGRLNVIRMTQPGVLTIHATATVAVGGGDAVQHLSTTVNVRACGASSSAPAFDVAHWFARGKPDVVYFEARAAAGAVFTWDFGDGTTQTTGEAVVAKSYALRAQDEKFSTFLVVATATLADGGVVQRRQTVTLNNWGFAGASTDELELPAEYEPVAHPATGALALGVGAAAAGDAAVQTSALRIRNTSSSSVSLVLAQVRMVDCHGGAGAAVDQPLEALFPNPPRNLEPMTIWSGDLVFPPGLAAGQCLAQIALLGQDAGGRPVRIDTVVELGVPETSQVVTDAVLLEAIAQARQILGRRDVSVDELEALARAGRVQLPNAAPIGYLDQAGPTGGFGWAYDPDAGPDSINVHIYVDGAFHSAVTASQSRPDLVSNGVTPNAEHGYTFTLTGLAPGQHEVQAYAIDDRGGPSILLTGAPKTVTVVDPASIALEASFLPVPAGARTTVRAGLVDPPAFVFFYDDTLGSYQRRPGGPCHTGQDNPTYLKIRLVGSAAQGCSFQASWDPTPIACSPAQLDALNSGAWIPLNTDAVQVDGTTCQPTAPPVPHLPVGSSAWFKVQLLIDGETHARTLAFSKGQYYVAHYDVDSWGACAGTGSYSCTASGAAGCSRAGVQTRTMRPAAWTLDPAQAAPTPGTSQSCTETASGYVGSYTSVYEAAWTCTAAGANGCAKSRLSSSPSSFVATGPDAPLPPAKIYTAGYSAAYAVGPWSPCDGTQTRTVQPNAWKASAPDAPAPPATQTCTGSEIVLQASSVPARGAARVSTSSIGANPPVFHFFYDEAQGHFAQQPGGPCNTGQSNPTYVSFRVQTPAVEACRFQASWDSAPIPCTAAAIATVNSGQWVTLDTDVQAIDPSRCAPFQPTRTVLPFDQAGWFQVELTVGGHTYTRRLNFIKDRYYVSAYTTDPWSACSGGGAFSCSSNTATGCSRAGSQTRTVSPSAWTVNPALQVPPPTTQQSCTETAQGYSASYTATYASSWTCVAAGANGCSKPRQSYAPATFKATAPDAAVPADRIYTTGYGAGFATGAWSACNRPYDGTQSRTVTANAWKPDAPDAAAPPASQACNTEAIALIASYMPAPGTPRTTFTSNSPNPPAFSFFYSEAQGSFEQQPGRPCNTGQANPGYLVVRFQTPAVEACQFQGSWDPAPIPCTPGHIAFVNSGGSLTLNTDTNATNPATCALEQPLRPILAAGQQGWFKIDLVISGVTYSRRINLVKQ